MNIEEWKKEISKVNIEDINLFVDTIDESVEVMELLIRDHQSGYNLSLIFSDSGFTSPTHEWKITLERGKTGFIFKCNGKPFKELSRTEKIESYPSIQEAWETIPKYWEGIQLKIDDFKSKLLSRPIT